MKQKVLIYRNHLLRGSETFIQSQANALQEFDPFYVGFKTVSKIEMPSEKMVTVHRSHSLRKSEIIRYQLCSKHQHFFREVAKEKPILVHAHFGPDGVKAMPLASYLQIPLVVTFHGFDVTLKPSIAQFSSYSYFMYLLKIQKLQKTASKLIAVSKFIKQKMILRGFPSEKICVHYIGIDTKKFFSTPALNRSPVVLFVGRLTEVKGCSFLIKAMAEVQAVFPEYELVIIGEGSLRQPLEKLASRKLKKFRFLGFQPQNVVREWMNKSKIFCVPSHKAFSGHEEAFGTVFLEAQAMGLPVVSCYSGGISEAVEHEKTGFLAPEKNFKMLAVYILKLIEDQSVWNRFSTNAIERVRSNFNIQQQTKKLERLYNEVIFDF